METLLGAHLSIAGGIHRALLRGKALQCRAIQLFTKSPNQWRTRPLSATEIEAFQRIRALTGISPVLSHASYLVNLASADPLLSSKSIEAMTEEIHRCHLLGISSVLVHPGFHGGRGEKEGLRRVSAAVDLVLAATKHLDVRIVLETTAGQGTALGCRFEHFTALFDRIRDVTRVCVCVDTCHVFAAGYDLRDREAYDRVIRAVEDSVGLEKLEVFHLNDSSGELGSRADRHAHIGEGRIGLEPFRFILRDERLLRVPKIIETPKEGAFHGPDGADRENLARLRSLVGRPGV